LANTHEICIEINSILAIFNISKWWFGFFKSSSVKRLSSSIKPESSSICTLMELSMVFLVAKDEPYLPRRRLRLNI